MTVLVTRAQPEAARWMRDLQAHGVDAPALPLTAGAALAAVAPFWPAAANLTHYAAAMFVSAGAVTGFFTANPQSAGLFGSRLRAWATGPGTAAALTQYGVPAAAIDSPPPAAG